ncbi:MAG TPA: DUF6252 family protein [Flavobacterium sp.]|nr:DUF6252 family protein [Flavobacterium sp.]
MKKIKFLSAAILLFTAFNFISCSEIEPIDPAIIVPIPNPDPDPDPNPGTGNFHVDFDSQTYVATDVEAAILDSQLVINGYKGTAPNMYTVGLAVSLTGSGLGTYPTNDNLIVYQQPGLPLTQYTSINPDDDAANTGSITITEIDAANHTISGTFHFTGYFEDAGGNVTTKEFTNGVFTDIPYTGDDIVNPTPTDNDLFANVNGIEFPHTNVTAVSAAGTITVTATAANGDKIIVAVADDLEVGTVYNFPPDVVCKYVKDGVTNQASGFVPATFEITAKTATTMQATFLFIVSGPTDIPIYTVTEGTFDIEF